jgi:hypothetical protein
MGGTDGKRWVVLIPHRTSHEDLHIFYNHMLRYESFFLWDMTTKFWNLYYSIRELLFMGYDDLNLESVFTYIQSIYILQILFVSLSTVLRKTLFLKIHKHENILSFFGVNQNLIFLWSMFEKKSNLSFNFCYNFDVRTFSRLLSIRRTITIIL